MIDNVFSGGLFMLVVALCVGAAAKIVHPQADRADTAMSRESVATPARPEATVCATLEGTAHQEARPDPSAKAHRPAANGRAS